ncbi:MAG: N-acetyl-gamma-glutamyl-phosphate reductase [Deltaproteobacteria bacterium]|jgi:N-acetyl-gamma-glutamyl-phosphate reductase|nr:N-acetyl-gamma-glutamyl-phosphate reductase [Deltaproteobacteria bacterium]
MKAGIVGVNGYTGQGLLQALFYHPVFRVTLATSRDGAGKKLSEVQPAYRGVAPYRDLVLSHPDSLEKMAAEDPENFPEVFLLCVSHGASMSLVPRILALGAKVVDLAGDFRLKDPALYPKWYKFRHQAPGLLAEAVYGLPELYREDVKKTRLVANPGCYPTSIILAAAPLAANKLISPDFPLVCDSKSGVSGAGRRAEEAYSFCEVNDNFKAYKMVGHQHTPEAQAALEGLSGGPLKISFTPHLLPLSRGILTTLYARPAEMLSEEEFGELYSSFYRNEPFVRFRGVDGPVSLLDVRGTNFCDLTLRLDEAAGLIKVVSVIDNLARGAVTQAVVNMNLVCGLDETLGAPAAPFRP